MNYFDPFVDKVAQETDDSSPDLDSKPLPQGVDLHTGSSQCEDSQENLESKKNSACCSKTSEEISTNNYATLPSSSSTKNQSHSVLNNRESYPPAVSGYNKLAHDSTSDLVVDDASNVKDSKKICKAGVVRRPSISKLKALFEKSGFSSGKSTNEGGKRSLFRNNSHSVFRAGSAPPSLNCMDKSAARERQSILMMVTRKFRSTSVKTEREICSKPSCDKSQHRKSNAMANLKEGFNTLSRTVSFNLTKKFRSYSPPKSRGEKTPDAPSRHISVISDEGSSISTRTNAPELQPKGKSVWYDKSALARAVPVMKPNEKICGYPVPEVPRSAFEKQVPDKSIYSVLNKPPKLLPFFGSLNKPNGRDMSTMWYGESNENLDCKGAGDVKSSSEGGTEEARSSKNTHKVLPFMPSFASWKKPGSKDPVINPESPKHSNFGEGDGDSRNSKFYAKIEEQPPVLEKELVKDVSVCPIPEEIIPLVPKSENIHLSEPSSTSSTASIESKQQLSSQEIPLSITPVKVATEQTVGIAKNDHYKIMLKEKDIPPAIPKKMLIGKNKPLENKGFFNEDVKMPPYDATKEVNPNMKSLLERKPQSAPVSPKDIYINVNLKVQKNLEQIENTVRNNPRNGIIDLTSRESYCMEEELDNALKQLSAPSEEPKPTAEKSNHKFSGYEVIWPESSSSTNSQEQIAKPACKSGSSELNASDVASIQCKTGIGYSPPLRRSVSSSMGLTKCQSCSNIDWLEPDVNVSLVGNSKEPGSSPTKKLVNEAVVELNTLLDQLTTRTLSEEPEFGFKTKQTSSCKEATSLNQNEMPKMQVEKENHMVHSVTLLSKSNASDSLAKEEEIIFHFPPPPPLPPPEDDQPSETFHIVRKNGCIIVADNKLSNDKSTEISISNDHKQDADSKTDRELPQPAPRKSKQGSGLKRSASYTNVCTQQKNRDGYENVFLEKYQTLSRLQIDSKDQSYDSKSSEVQSKQKTRNLKPDYVNISDIKNSSDVEQKTLNVNIGNSASPMVRVGEGSEQQLLNVHRDIKITSIESDMSKSCPPSAFKTNVTASLNVSDYKTHSTYGKISKLPVRKLLIADEIPQEPNPSGLGNFLGSKKKPVPFRKTERAPRPPDVHISDNIGIQHDKINTQPQAFSKKLPSRKLEKAPLPPPTLQKSSSSANVPQKNFSSTPYMNFSPSRPHFADEALVLPAVRENISNTELTNSVITAKKRIESELKSNKGHGAGHSLSHSRSDASIFFALKQRKIQALNQRQESANAKPPILNKILNRNKELHSVSSSDSDSSYERIFFDKPVEQSQDSSEGTGNEQTSTTKNSKKEVPIAPPRSKRRNTTEIHYAKVKTKEASPLTSLNAHHHQKAKPSIEELPPAIPVKTKDAFENSEFGNKIIDHSIDKGTHSSSK